MNNFDEKNSISIAKFILAGLMRHDLFALGTTYESQQPRIVCLNLSFDAQLNIIWKSQKKAAHSRHIDNNAKAAICIFSKDEELGDFGFYTQVIAREVKDEIELKKCLDIKYKAKGKAIPPIDNFVGNAPERIYVAEIQKAWVNDSRHLKTEVDLDTLRNEG
ncbi:pyridoxamine 5'-phosphate oxidase family protein, partial [Candidatus Uhrbacteria bacterium]|nr:pyridoxamine 5'-phosphate oxidase family protein [Candidatus Uhrbacteria bacterium]